MQRLRNLPDWRMPAWWLAVLGVALLLKQHYSIAAAADLDWMLRPLSLLLEWASGHAFYRDSLGEWVSVSAEVRLVKACAGINFMLMSLLAWAWIFRSAPGNSARTRRWIVGRLLLLTAVMVAAWSTSLLANGLRILIAMNLPDLGNGVHRMLGMMIYLPLLSLQLLLGDGRNWKTALAGPLLLYSLLMVMVPIVTGNALLDPALFIEHLLYLSAMAALMVGLILTCLTLVSHRHWVHRSGSQHRRDGIPGSRV
ncbi:MAG: exosortase K [Gammaproteobacteria bacterium]|nr:exosortase K [Gammaproteobacteria bacterium]